MSMAKEIGVSRETSQKLEQFVCLVEKWTKKINLIGPMTVEDIWDRHILDSVQLFEAVDQTWQSWTDIGSGGGFPGIVVAILDLKQRPVTLIESDTRKCLFLKTAKRELGLNVEVLDARIEEVNISKADVVSARALASLNKLMPYAVSLMSPRGTAIFPKGQRYQEELDDALLHWNFEYEMVQSVTNAGARLIKVKGITKREC